MPQLRDSMRVRDPRALRRAIAERRATYRSIEAASGVSSTFVNELATGQKSTLHRDKAEAIAKALGEDVDVLFEADGDTDQQEAEVS